MSKTVTIQYCGMQADGATVKEAKQNAARKLEAAISGDYTPKIITTPGGKYTAILWREPEWYCYSVLDNDKRREAGRESLMYGSSSGYKTMADCETSARNHLAQNLINTATGEDGQAVLLSADDRADHRRYVEWQYLYKAWKAQGLGDNEAHDSACQYKTPPGYMAHYEDSVRFLRS